MQRHHRELARVGVGTEQPEIGDDEGRPAAGQTQAGPVVGPVPVPDGRAEVERFHEGPATLANEDDDLAAGAGDLGGAAGTGQADRGVVVVADDR